MSNSFHRVPFYIYFIFFLSVRLSKGQERYINSSNCFSKYIYIENYVSSTCLIAIILNHQDYHIYELLKFFITIIALKIIKNRFLSARYCIS